MTMTPEELKRIEELASCPMCAASLCSAHQVTAHDHIPSLLAYVRELEGIVADMDSRVRELAGPEVMKLEDEWVAALAARDEAREIVRHARFEAPWKRKAFEAIVKWDKEEKR